MLGTLNFQSTFYTFPDYYRSTSGSLPVANNIKLRFAQQINPRSGGKYGYDMVRGYAINDKKIKLKYFEEVYSTKELLVRVYRVKTTQEISRANFLRKKKKNLRNTNRQKKQIAPEILPSNLKRSQPSLMF